MKTMAKRIAAGLLIVVMICAALSSCAKKEDGVQLIFNKAGEYTYNTYTSVSPSNWNELTYQDNNDTQIMSYIGSSFFGFDYKYDADGKIVPGEFEIIYEAATKLEDVTAKYKEAWNIRGDKHMAYAITLRNDLKWDDGTPIKAEDFVYTMQEQLNPLFQNYRADYTAKCTTASLKGFGLYNSMHYYDVANGAAYRESDEAKKVLCEVYNVDWTDTAKYPTLDDAVNAITGYDLVAAKALFTSAYNQAIEAGTMTADDKVVLVFGTGAIDEATRRHYDYLTTAWTNAVKDTPLDGKLEFDIQDFSDAWADDFRAGKYEICMGGWTGAAWDPGYFLMAYLSPTTAFSAGWDTTKQMMTFTMVGVKDPETGEDITATMSLMDWYYCLNGAPTAAYNWSSSALDQSLRLQLIAALEKEVLKMYYSVPTYNTFSASLMSHKVDYITYEYNTFMGYGGFKYMTHNYDDAEWRAAVKEQGGKLNYK